MDNKTFKLPLAERMAHLANKEFFSDVFFRVGISGEIMYGHKVILTVASEVFYAQFNGHFAESHQCTRENPVVVDDIEPSVFREILNYMYGGKVNISTDNVLDIYYAAQKYMLTELDGMCQKFFISKISDENVLKLFNQNRRYEFSKINAKCLDVIWDNPIKCFKHEDFYTLEKRSLELIIRTKQINCREDHLLEAIQSWLKVNELQYQDGINLADIVREEKNRQLKCKKLHNYCSFQYVPQIKTDISVTATSPQCLYGLGIFVKPMSSFLTTHSVDVHIKVEHVNRSEVPDVISSFETVKTIPVLFELHIEEIIFEKIIIDEHSVCNINVSINDKGKNTLMFCLQDFKSIDELSVSLKVSNLAQAINSNCIAYLLYDFKARAFDGVVAAFATLSPFERTLKRNADK
ncbi:kelch-like protein 41 [Toxorhynchites rutilus septentrionalis]|uniref:kelch-like protein 41 n=1 Tax=Toxorhynchites rutilus septentrionalis TaxID=329112 RepID=UPI0024788517|nr:kelch-like protein 41 [Toxorhynchites rutilus septentrionalis]